MKSKIKELINLAEEQRLKHDAGSESYAYFSGMIYALTDLL